MTTWKEEPLRVFPSGRAIALATATGLLLLASWTSGLTRPRTPEDTFGNLLSRQDWFSFPSIKIFQRQASTSHQAAQEAMGVATLQEALGGSTQTNAGVNETAGGSLPEDTLSFRIIGSKLNPGEDVKTFRKKWDCITSRDSYEWKLDPTPRPLPWPRSKFKGSCHSREGYLGFQSNDEVAAGSVTADTWGVADSLKYVWRAKEDRTCGGLSPDFTVLDGNATCAALRRMKGTLFIVGDSISDQFYISLLQQMTIFQIGHKQRAATPACQQLAKDVYLSTGAAAEMRTMCIHYFICGTSWDTGAVQMHFARSMYLRRLHNMSEEQDELFPEPLRLPELPWAEDAVRYRARVIVLNRGAHFIPNEAGYIQQLNYTLQELRRMLPTTLIIFRSTAAGHPNCSNYSGPVASPLQVESWPFNWEKFEEQNRIARILVESVGGVFFDVSPMTSLRPDWHVAGSRNDCLHHCLPGPVDDWVKMLSKMLQELL